MTTLTPELRQAIEKAGTDPVRIEDPETRAAYVVLRAEDYDRIQPRIEHGAAPGVPRPMPEAVRRSRQAFLRDLPELLRSTKGNRWAAYHGDERIGTAPTETELYQACRCRGWDDDTFYVGWIGEQGGEIEAVDPSFFEADDVMPRSEPQS